MISYEYAVFSSHIYQCTAEQPVDGPQGQGSGGVAARGCGWQTYLEEGILIVPQLVVMFHLHSNGLVRVNVAQFYVSGVAHEEGSIETSGSEASAGTHSHHTVKPNGPSQAVLHIFHDTPTILVLEVGGAGVIGTDTRHTTYCPQSHDTLPTATSHSHMTQSSHMKSHDTAYSHIPQSHDSLVT